MLFKVSGKSKHYHKAKKEVHSTKGAGAKPASACWKKPQKAQDRTTLQIKINANKREKAEVANQETTEDSSAESRVAKNEGSLLSDEASEKETKSSCTNQVSPVILMCFFLLISRQTFVSIRL